MKYYILICFFQIAILSRSQSNYEDGTGFNSIFQQVKQGSFIGEVNGRLIIKSAKSPNDTLYFKNQGERLVIIPDENEVYDVSTKKYIATSINGDVSFEYSTYCLANSVTLKYKNNEYINSMIDGGCDLVIPGLKWVYKKEGAKELLYLFFTDRLDLYLPKTCKTPEISILPGSMMKWSIGYGQNSGSYFEQLSSKPDFKEVKSFADSVYNLGKRAIPLLINDIARKEKVFIGFGKRHLSTFPPAYWRDNYRGIRSVYFIEYVLKRDSIYKQNKESLNNMPEGEAKDMVLESYLYYLWNSNVIAKNVNDEPLTYEDMQKVKKIYERWWRVNRHKSIDELRKEFWRKSILEGSPYHWL